MNRFSSHIVGPRWAKFGQALEVFAMRNGIDIKIVTTKYILSERIDFTITGTDKEIELINRCILNVVKEYNKD